MRSPDHQLAYLQLLLDSLEPYLLSREIFWPLEPGTGLSGETPSRLSLGALALTLDRLAVEEPDLPPSKKSSLLRLQRQWEAHQAKWRVAVERKAVLETHARLRLWSTYLDDLDETEGAREDYPHEVRQRVMVARLAPWSGAGEEAERNTEQTRVLDARLQRRFEAGPFVWEDDLSPIYAAPGFWFLYGRPSERPGGYLA
jgi:hypothetical protein